MKRDKQDPEVKVSLDLGPSKVKEPISAEDLRSRYENLESQRKTKASSSSSYGPTRDTEASRFAPEALKMLFFDSQTQTPAHPQTPEKQQHAQSGACGSCARRWRTSTSNSATLPPAQQRSPRSSKPSACAGSCSLHPLQGDADNALQAAALAAHRRHVTRPGPLAAACGCHALPAKKARRSAPRAAGGATAREGTRGPGAAPPTGGAERTRALAPRLTWLHTRRARGAPSSRLLLAALSEASCAAACTRCAASRSQSSF